MSSTKIIKFKVIAIKEIDEKTPVTADLYGNYEDEYYKIDSVTDYVYFTFSN